MAEEIGSGDKHRVNAPLLWVPIAAIGFTLISLPEHPFSSNGADTVEAAPSDTFVQSLVSGMDRAFHGKDFPLMGFSITGDLATKTSFEQVRDATLDAMDADHASARNNALAGCAVAATVDLHNRITPEAANAFNTGQFEVAEAVCRQSVTEALRTHQIDHLYAPTGLVTR